MSENKQVTTSTSQSVSPAATSGPDQQRAVLPAVDVFEDADGITLLADMPGVPKEHLELKIDGEALLIEGGVQPQTPEGLEPVYAEVRIPRYRRSFMLSRELDTTRIEANLKDGTLMLRIPKQAHAQPRRISVTTG